MPGGQRGGSLQDRGHDREVARGNDTHTRSRARPFSSA
jgi:hypothetical protein